MNKEPEDIKNLNAKINEFKQRHLNSEDLPHIKSSSASETVTGFQISTELIAGLLVGAGIGYLIDSIFNTLPWGMIIFLIFGELAGILNIYKTFNAQDKKSGVN